jgi:hypothetical protein
LIEEKKTLLLGKSRARQNKRMLGQEAANEFGSFFVAAISGAFWVVPLQQNLERILTPEMETPYLEDATLCQ